MSYTPITCEATTGDRVVIERGNHAKVILSLAEAQSLLTKKLPDAVRAAEKMASASPATRIAELERQLEAARIDQRAIDDHARREAEHARRAANTNTTKPAAVAEGVTV